MTLVIGPLGTVSDLANDRVDDATRNEGCIHIHRTAGSVILSVAFDRLTGPAIAAALYELYDMRSEKICLVISKNDIIEILIGLELIFRRICAVYANALIREECADTPYLPEVLSAI